MRFTPILFSVSYSGSWGQARLSVEDFVNHAADLGFAGVMLGAKRPHLSLLDYDDKARARLRQQLEARGLRTICVAGYNNFTADLEHAEIPTREIQVHYVVELARLARDIGGNLVRVFTGYESPAGDLSWRNGIWWSTRSRNAPSAPPSSASPSACRTTTTSASTTAASPI